MSANHERWHGPIVTVALSGDIDHRNAHEIVYRVAGVVNRGARRVVVDLEAVDFMDAAALGALVRSRNLSRPHGANVRVRCSDRRFRRLFVLTGLGKLLEVNDVPGR